MNLRPAGFAKTGNLLSPSAARPTAADTEATAALAA